MSWPGAGTASTESRPHPEPQPDSAGSPELGSDETDTEGKARAFDNDDIDQARSAAVRLLISFIGAAQGSLYSVTSFVDDVLACYRCVHARW